MFLFFLRVKIILNSKDIIDQKKLQRQKLFLIIVWKWYPQNKYDLSIFSLYYYHAYKSLLYHLLNHMQLKIIQYKKI